MEPIQELKHLKNEILKINKRNKKVELDKNGKQVPLEKYLYVF